MNRPRLQSRAHTYGQGSDEDARAALGRGRVSESVGGLGIARAWQCKQARESDALHRMLETERRSLAQMRQSLNRAPTPGPPPRSLPLHLQGFIHSPNLRRAEGAQGKGSKSSKGRAEGGGKGSKSHLCSQKCSCMHSTTPSATPQPTTTTRTSMIGVFAGAENLGIGVRARARVERRGVRAWHLVLSGSGC